MLLDPKELLALPNITNELLQASTYITSSNHLAIRLFNTKEHLASVQALLPSTTELKRHFSLGTYKNIKPLRSDYVDAKYRGNWKTDVILREATIADAIKPSIHNKPAESITPSSPWWSESLLSLQGLIDILNTNNLPYNQIRPSLYTIGGNVAIRLFNTKEHRATIPALLPNDKRYKQLLGLTSNPEVNYHNIKHLRSDYEYGYRVKNSKTDLILANPQVELELFNDNNSTKL